VQTAIITDKQSPWIEAQPPTAGVPMGAQFIRV
jgi:hypothetical protein